MSSEFGYLVSGRSTFTHPHGIDGRSWFVGDIERATGYIRYMLEKFLMVGEIESTPGIYLSNLLGERASSFELRMRNSPIVRNYTSQHTV